MKDLTKGSPLKLIILFAVPIFFGQLFQLFYSIVDTRIVGETLGESALAAVGGVSTLSDLMINIVSGAASGFAIISATCFGAKNMNALKKSVRAAFFLSSASAIVFSFFTIIFLDRILNILNVLPSVYENSKAYIFTLLTGLICTALYNSCAATLRAVGDSFTPLVFLIISTVINVFLDYTFILNFQMGVSGAALATVISQGISFILCFIYMWIKYPDLRFISFSDGFNNVFPEKELLSKLLRSGISMSLMYSLVSFGTLSLQTAINSFGENIIVAHAAARKLFTVYILPWPCFGQALATFCGQNMGAGKYDRIKKGLYLSCLINFGWDILMIISAFTLAPSQIQLITASDVPEIIETAARYMRINTLFFFVPTLISFIRNSLQGIGDTITPVISSFIELAGKVLIAVFLAPSLGYFGIIISEPIVWILMVIPLITRLFTNPVFKIK